MFRAGALVIGCIALKGCVMQPLTDLPNYPHIEAILKDNPRYQPDDPRAWPVTVSVIYRPI
jgi:hypothetical protein